MARTRGLGVLAVFIAALFVSGLGSDRLRVAFDGVNGFVSVQGSSNSAQPGDAPVPSVSAVEGARVPIAAGTDARRVATLWITLVAVAIVASVVVHRNGRVLGRTVELAIGSRVRRWRRVLAWRVPPAVVAT